MWRKMQETPGGSPILDWAVEFMWPHSLATQLHLETQVELQSRQSLPPEHDRPSSLLRRVEVRGSPVSRSGGHHGPRGGTKTSDGGGGQLLSVYRPRGCRRSNTDSLPESQDKVQVLLQSLHLHPLTHEYLWNFNYQHRDVQMKKSTNKWSHVSTLNTPGSFKCTYKNRKRRHLHTGVALGKTVKAKPF